MTATSLKFKRAAFIGVFTFVAMLCAHPLTARFPSLGMEMFLAGASAMVGMLLAYSIFRQ